MRQAIIDKTFVALEFNLCFLLLQTDLNIAASFDRRGKYVFSGNAKGKVTVHRVSNMNFEASFKIGQGATAVKSIEFSRRGE